MSDYQSIPAEIWPHITRHLDSFSIISLWMTGNSHLQSIIGDQSASLEFDENGPSLWNLRFFPRLSSLVLKTATNELRLNPTPLPIHLPDYLQSLTIGISFPISIPSLQSLNHLKLLDAALKPLPPAGDAFKLLPRSLTHLYIRGNFDFNQKDVLDLPPRLTQLQLPFSFGDLLLPKLPENITFLCCPFDLLDQNMPLYGLPSTLKTLKLLPGSWMKVVDLSNLPPTLEELEGFGISVDERTVHLLPKGLTCIQVNAALWPIVTGALPRTLKSLSMCFPWDSDVSHYEQAISLLPSNLTQLNLRSFQLHDHHIALLPQTLNSLQLSNGMLTGQSNSHLPRNLKTLIVEGGSNKETKAQPFIPFCFDPFEMAKLPPSLESIHMTKMPNLPNEILDRLPPSVTRISIGTNRLVNCLIDLRHIVSTQEAIQALKSVKLYLEENSITISKPPRKIHYYVTYPERPDFSTSINLMTQDREYDSFDLFMKGVQTLYELVGAYSNLGGQECTVLLPSVQLDKLSEISHIFVPRQNKRLSHLHPLATTHILDSSTSDILVPSKPILGVDVVVSSTYEKIDHVAAGGTFDHMHVGHKLLLTACLALARKRIVLGISDGALLVNKKYKEQMHSFERRFENVERFCKLQNPDVRLELVRLLDTAGPTATDESLQVCVVSQETAKGVDYINNVRSEKGLPLMQGRIIDLAESSEDLKQLSLDSKVSSTTLRLKDLKMDEMMKQHVEQLH